MLALCAGALRGQCGEGHARLLTSAVGPPAPSIVCVSSYDGAFIFIWVRVCVSESLRAKILLFHLASFLLNNPHMVFTKCWMKEYLMLAT